MAQIISNQATATYTFEGSREARTAVSNVATTTLLDDYSLEVNKQNYQQCFRPGENVTYSIRVSNTGCRKLKDFIIVDDLGKPENGLSPLVYMEGSARLSIGGEFMEINPTSTDPLTFNVSNTLLAGEHFIITYIATVDQAISSGLLEITNTANVSAVSGCDDENQTRYSDSDTSSLPRCTDANLIITKQVSKSSICSCDSYDYIITIENSGLLDANNVVVTDYLPQGFSVNSIRVENEDTIHDYDPTEYSLDDNNFLTLPNISGTVINVRSVEPGITHSAVVTINGSFSSPTTNA